MEKLWTIEEEFLLEGEVYVDPEISQYNDAEENSADVEFDVSYREKLREGYEDQPEIKKIVEVNYIFFY